MRLTHAVVEVAVKTTTVRGAALAGAKCFSCSRFSASRVPLSPPSRRAVRELVTMGKAGKD